MYISRRLKRTNIVEYVLYMWHIEEMIRSLNHDINEIEHKVIVSFNLDNKKNAEMIQWYVDLIDQMKEERIKEKGHFEELNEILAELSYLHTSLLTVYRDTEYQTLLATAQDDLEALKGKSGKKNSSDIELSMNALFGVLVLKLKGKKVSEATQMAVKSISKMMAHLAAQYRKMKEGTLELPTEMSN